jgi:hypothetical protein
MRIQIKLFALMRIQIRILLLIKVMVENLRSLVSTGTPSRAPFETSGHYCELSRPSTALFFVSLKLLNFDFNADPDPVFRSSADLPDLACKNNVDPCGSESAFLHI